MNATKLSYANYNAICKDTASHLSFCRDLLEHLLEYSPARDGEVTHWLSKTVDVDGKPFSCAKHMVTIELKSINWDFMDEDVALQTQVVDKAIALQKYSPTYNMAPFIDGLPYVASVVLKRDMAAETAVGAPAAAPHDAFAFN
jgi:hypothetical protein